MVGDGAAGDEEQLVAAALLVAGGEEGAAGLGVVEVAEEVVHEKEPTSERARLRYRVPI